MAGQLAEFILTGDYLFKGRTGSQNGRVIYYSDGKLIGTIGDDDSGTTAGKQKLFLGMAQDDGRRISFLKIAPLGFHLYPVIWTMDADAAPTEGLAKNYSGCWMLVDGLPLENELEAALKMNETDEILRSMEELDADELEQVYFRQEIIRLVRKNAKRANHAGRLSFSRIAARTGGLIDN